MQSISCAVQRIRVMALLSWLLTWFQPAQAEGVLAVGITSDVARDGFVIGP